MRYSEIIRYVREGDTLRAYRQTKVYGTTINKEVPMSQLFAGHTQKIADMIEEQRLRNEMRYMNSNNRKAA